MSLFGIPWDWFKRFIARREEGRCLKVLKILVALVIGSSRHLFVHFLSLYLSLE